MTPPKFVFCLIYLLLGKMGQVTLPKISSSCCQEQHFMSVKTSERLTLLCSFETDIHILARLQWYKETLGQKPRLISTFSSLDKNGTFHNEFKNNPRFTLDTENRKNHLTITGLIVSDSGKYYCISSHLYKLEFCTSITVNVEGSGVNIPALVHQSASETIQHGDSVTLNCTVHTGTCDGEHRVYWFRHSEESHPGLIYSHGGRQDQCERKPDTQTHTCVYNLPMESLDQSHAGTYYCAVASCGYIVFGNGTMLGFKDEADFHVLVYFLSGALTVSTILVVLLAFYVYKMTKRSSFQSPGSPATLSAPPVQNAETYQDASSLHYAALSVDLPNRSSRQRNNTKSECMYSSVKH